ncbi:MAG TPA: hypothetical protein VI168_13270 [Croceibacterium sp.]
MDQVQELKDEVGRVSRLIDAGQRGVPIGGELLIAFGLTFGLLGVLGGATAFSLLPLEMTPSLLGPAGAFLTFALMFKGTKTQLTTTLLGVAVALAAGEVIARTIQALDWKGQTVTGYAAVVVLVLVPLAMFVLGIVVGLRRLRQSAAATAPANHAVLGAWTGLAAAMAVMLVLCFAVTIRTGNGVGFMFLPGLFWILWGTGWWTSAAITRSRWMYAVAAGSWGVAACYAATSWFYSTSIVGLLALAVLPGLQLVREARTTHEA